MLAGFVSSGSGVISRISVYGVEVEDLITKGVVVEVYFTGIAVGECVALGANVQAGGRDS